MDMIWIWIFGYMDIIIINILINWILENGSKLIEIKIYKFYKDIMIIFFY